MEKKLFFSRYLLLDNIKKLKKDKYLLELGNSELTSKEIILEKNFLETILQIDGEKNIEELLINVCEEKKSSYKLAITKLIDEGILTLQEKSSSEQRYDRHILFYDMCFGKGYNIQQKLLEKKVCLIGMGGIGCWLSYNLACVGFGELLLVDHDKIELSNLTRQILYSESDIGKEKVICAKDRLETFNSDIKITAVSAEIKSEHQLSELIKSSDFVVISADKPRYKIQEWTDKACANNKVPYINCGYLDHMGLIGPLIDPHKKSNNKIISHDYSINNEPLINKAYSYFNSNYQAPSFGPLNSIVSSLGAMEIVKYFINPSDCNVFNRRMIYDPLNNNISYVNQKLLSDF